MLHCPHSVAFRDYNWHNLAPWNTVSYIILYPWRHQFELRDLSGVDRQMLWWAWIPNNGSFLGQNDISYYFVREDDTRRVIKRETKIWGHNNLTWGIVKHRKEILAQRSLHINNKLLDQMFCMLSAGSNVARIVCVNRNMKIANSSHIKRIFHYFFCVFVVVVVFFFRRSGGGNMQFSANSSRLFHHTSESFSKRKDICFLMAASVRSRWLDIGRVLF